MKLEQQVCNLELSMRLKNKGIAQKGQWLRIKNKRPPTMGFTLMLRGYSGRGKDYYSAFTVAELSLMLGKGYLSYLWEDEWYASKNHSEHNRKGKRLSVYSSTFPGTPTQADALATLLVRCIEVECLDIKEINKRLIG